MRYIWERTSVKRGRRRVMHIARFDQTGEMLMESLCRIGIAFNASINAPWGLGRRICKRCKKVAQS